LRELIHLPQSGAILAGVDDSMDRLSGLVVRHCREHGYRLVDSVDSEDGYRRFSIAIPGGDAHVRLTFNGEVFMLSFPGGYSWTEYAYCDDDRAEAVEDQLRFLDAFFAAGTHEVVLPRRLRPDRRELHVSNGAVLSVRGWSKGPTE
jgi:hypothetical protein